MDNLLFLINWAFIDVLYIYAFYNLFRYNKGFYKCSVSRLFIVGIVVSTFCFVASDYYGYRMNLERLEMYTFSINFEVIYWQIARYVEYDNVLFRLILSFSAFLCYAIIIKKYAINKTITSYIAFIFLFYNTANLLRSSVSDGILFIGVLYFYHKRSFASAVLLCMLFALGTVFHKSAFMVMVIFVLAFFMKYKTVRMIAVILLPVEILVVRLVVGWIFSRYFPESNYAAFEIPDSRIGIAKILINILFFICFLYILLSRSKTVLNGNKVIRGLYQYVFCTFILWIIFLFSGSERFVADRLLMHASIPITLLLSYSYIKGNNSSRKIYNYYLICWFLCIQLSIFIVWLYHRDLLSANKYIGLI